MDGTFWLHLHQAMNRTADPLMPRLAVASAVASIGHLAMLVYGPNPWPSHWVRSRYWESWRGSFVGVRQCAFEQADRLVVCHGTTARAWRGTRPLDWIPHVPQRHVVLQLCLHDCGHGGTGELIAIRSGIAADAELGTRAQRAELALGACDLQVVDRAEISPTMVLIERGIVARRVGARRWRRPPRNSAAHSAVEPQPGLPYRRWPGGRRTPPGLRVLPMGRLISQQSGLNRCRVGHDIGDGRGAGATAGPPPARSPRAARLRVPARNLETVAPRYAGPRQ